MENKLKNSEKHTLTIAMLAVLSAVFAFLSALIGELFVPATAAALAALYLYDTSKNRLTSILISTAVILLSTVVAVLIASYSFILGVEAVLLAAVAAVCYSGGVSKSATVLFTTAVSVVMVVASLLVMPMIAQSSLSFDAVSTFYETLYGLLREEFVASFDVLMQSVSVENLKIELTAEDAVQIFDAALHMLISLVIIAGFVIAGLTVKLFCAFVKRLDADTKRVSEWRFVTPSTYANFYLILSVLNLFMSSVSDILGITVANLYLVFMFVYAYVGIKLIYNHFGEHNSKAVVAFLVLVILVCLPGTSLQIFSLIGVFYTFYRNKVDSGDFSGFTSNKQ